MSTKRLEPPTHDYQRYQTRSVHKAQEEAVRHLKTRIVQVIKNDIDDIISEAAGVHLVTDGLSRLTTESSCTDSKMAYKFIETVQGQMSILHLDTYNKFLDILEHRPGLENVADLIKETVKIFLLSPSPHGSPSPSKKFKLESMSESNKSPDSNEALNDTVVVSEASPPPDYDAAVNEIPLDSLSAFSSQGSSSLQPIKFEQQDVPEDIRLLHLQHQKIIEDEVRNHGNRLAWLQIHYKKEEVFLSTISSLRKDNSVLSENNLSLANEKRILQATISSKDDLLREKDLQLEELQKKVTEFEAKASRKSSRAGSNPASSKYKQRQLSKKGGLVPHSVLREINKENIPTLASRSH